jgi:hypothetical protein
MLKDFTGLYAKKPVITIVHLGRWYLDQSIWFMPGTTFTDRLEHLRKNLREWGKGTTQYLKKSPKSNVIWVVQEPMRSDSCMKTTCGPELNYRNNILNEMVLLELKQFPNIWIWKSGRYLVEQHISSGLDVFLEDGVHINAPLRSKQVQILYNLLCNDMIKKDGEDRICRCGI